MVGSLLVGIRKSAFLRYSVIALSFAGFCFTLLGVLSWSYYDQFYLYMREGIEFGHVWDKLAWDPMYSPIIVHAKALYENYAASIPVQHYSHTIFYWVSYGLAPCPVDNYIYCTYGIGTVASILVLIGAVMAVILWRINVLKSHNRIVAAIRRGRA
jgi:hypothetical protein